MFTVIPSIGKNCNMAKLAAHMKCDYSGQKLWEFPSLWSQAVHGNCFHRYMRFDRETRTEVIGFFDTETSAVSLVQKDVGH